MTTPARQPRDDSDVFDRYEVIWRWTPPADAWTDDERLVDDIADEYAIVRNEGCITGVMLMARHDDRWVANASSRPVIAELLRRLDRCKPMLVLMWGEFGCLFCKAHPLDCSCERGAKLNALLRDMGWPPERGEEASGVEEQAPA